MNPPRALDAAALCDALGTRAPAASDRQYRIKLLGEFATATLAGKKPSRESVMFVAGAVSGWLANGGDLERDYLRVTGKAGSHCTAANLWQAISSSRGATDSESAPTVGTSLRTSE